MHPVFRGFAAAMPLCWVLAASSPTLASGPGSACAVPTRSSTLDVLTWNLHADRGRLSRLVADVAGGRASGGPAEHQVLLLQEVSEASVRAVAGEHGLSVFFAPVQTGTDRPRGNALLASAPLAELRAIELPRERQRRGAAAGRLDLFGTRLFVASTHLENRYSWWRGGPLSEAGRARQAAALLRQLPGAHGIVGGDINTLLGVGEPALSLLLSRFPDTPPGPWSPTFRGRLVLDHVFLDLPDGWAAERTVLPDRYGSDHHPVAARITVRAAGPCAGEHGRAVGVFPSVE